MLSIILPNKLEKNVHDVVSKLEDYYPLEIIISCDRYGRGKGWAIKQGLEQARGDTIILIDSDGDVEPYEILKLIPHLAHYDIAVGKKSINNLPFHRKVITFLSRLYIKFMFGISVDTQTGLKIFNYKPYFISNGFAYDIEVLARARIMNKTMIEIPIKAKVSSRMGGKILWQALLESIKIKFLL
jgi:glycosyltransferase involved in cell wall biosynthesis